MFSFGTSIHKDVSERLPYIKPDLAEQVYCILQKNKQERHIRGGMATKRKYAQLRAARHEQET